MLRNKFSISPYFIYIKVLINSKVLKAEWSILKLTVYSAIHHVIDWYMGIE